MRESISLRQSWECFATGAQLTDNCKCFQFTMKPTQRPLSSPASVSGLVPRASCLHAPRPTPLAARPLPHAVAPANCANGLRFVLRCVRHGLFYMYNRRVYKYSMIRRCWYRLLRLIYVDHKRCPHSRPFAKQSRKKKKQQWGVDSDNNNSSSSNTNNNNNITTIVVNDNITHIHTHVRTKCVRVRNFSQETDIHVFVRFVACQMLLAPWLGF